jgi:predicted HicB family RNase H-like nuclease
LGIRGLISYEGETGKLLEVDFKEAIDMYLADCKAEGKNRRNHLKEVLM